MSKNFEVKVGPVSLSDVQKRASEIAETGPFVLDQADYFFHVTNGRLKLRVESRDGEAETAQLIAYERPDNAEARLSDYLLYTSSDANVLRECLTRSLGCQIVVKKQRTLFLTGRARIHLDEVEGLGEFVEIEVVLEEGASGEAGDGQQELQLLLGKLGIDDAAVVPVAYADLLQNPVKGL